MALITGLVSYYPLHTDTLDAHGSNDGTGTALTYVAGRIARAVTGNGTTSKVDLGASPDLNFTGDFSISLWVRIQGDVDSDLYLVTRQVGDGSASLCYSFRIYPGNHVQFTTIAGSVTAFFVYPNSSRWVPLVVTRSGTTVRLYVDGSEVVNGTLAVGTSLPSQPTLIGSRPDGASNLGDDSLSISDVGFWSRTLDAGEVRQLANVRRGITYPFEFVLLDCLEAFHTLDSSIYDSAQHAHGGTRWDVTFGGSPIWVPDTLPNDGTAKGMCWRHILDTDVIAIGSGIPLANRFSVSMWIKHSGTPPPFGNPSAALWAYSTGSGRGLYAINDNGGANARKFAFFNGTSSLESAGTWTAGQWIHVTLTYDAGSVVFYLNGALDSSGVLALPESFILTQYANINNYYGFNGDMQSVGVWSRALSSDEVASVYNDGVPLDITDANVGGSSPVPPVISNISPAPGGIGKFTPITFDVTDEQNAFTRILLVASFPSGIREVVYDGAGFGPQYTNGYNTTTSITNGYTFQILRNGGWAENPTITPFVIDQTGAENV